MIDFEKLSKWVTPVAEQRYDEKFCILYALAHGLGDDPMDASQLGFLVPPLQAVFPTLPIALANADRRLAESEAGIDYGRVVLGEQSLELHLPLPTQAVVICTGGVSSIIDKGAGKNAIIKLTRQLYEKGSDQPLATMTASYIARGQGGFNGLVDGTQRPSLPNRPADGAVELATLPQLALLYDLTGDYVDFHISPAAALRAGFPRPILHGICTVGLAARAALMAAGTSGAVGLQALSVRLGLPVFPGERLRFDFWRDGKHIHLRGIAMQRDVEIIPYAEITLI